MVCERIRNRCPGNEYCSERGNVPPHPQAALGGWARVPHHELNGKGQKLLKSIDIRVPEVQDGKAMANWKQAAAHDWKRQQSLRRWVSIPRWLQKVIYGRKFGYRSWCKEKGQDSWHRNNRTYELYVWWGSLYLPGTASRVFDLTTGFYRRTKAMQFVKYICANMGLESTTNMTVRTVWNYDNS